MRSAAASTSSRPSSRHSTWPTTASASPFEIPIAQNVGEPESWDKAEDALREIVCELGVPYTEELGEAAFYGPKIDFVVKDVLGREWHLAPSKSTITYPNASTSTTSAQTTRSTAQS